MSTPSQTLSRVWPEEWADPKRAKFLMAEFRPRAANPEGYDAKMAFWKRNITAWSGSNQIVSFTVSDVRKAFSRDGALPDVACVKRVLSEMMTNEEVRPRREVEKLLNEKAVSNSWTSWSRGVDLLKKPLSWGWSLLSYSGAETDGNESIIDGEMLVSLSSLAVASADLSRGLGDEKQIWSQSELSEAAAAKGISKSDLQLSLLYLQSERKACVTEDCGTRLVKFGEDAAFNQLELGLYRLQSAKELIEKDMRQIESGMNTLRQEARQAVKNNNRTQATQLLRRKKRLENLLGNKESQLDNIDVLLQQMSDSDSNVMILQSFQQAADVLKSIQASGPLTSDVDKTMLSVEDVMQNTASMQADLSRTIDPFGDYGEEGLDEELQEILQSTVAEDVSGQKMNDVDDLLFRLERLRSPDAGSAEPKLADVPRRNRSKAAEAGHT